MGFASPLDKFAGKGIAAQAMKGLVCHTGRVCLCAVSGQMSLLLPRQEKQESFMA
jgi:hypothetical protein